MAAASVAVHAAIARRWERRRVRRRARYGAGFQGEGQDAAVRKRLAEQPAPVQPPKRAAPASALPALEIGADMEVQGCGPTCDFVCTECAWEGCRVVADHGDVCEVCILSDGEECTWVQRPCAACEASCRETGGSDCS